MAFLYLSWALDIKKAAALANWLAPKEGARFSLIYFFDSFCIYYIPHNYVTPQAMPHAIPQTHSFFYPQRGETSGSVVKCRLFSQAGSLFVLFLFFRFVFLIKRAIEYLKSDHEWKSLISPHVRSSRFQNLEKFFLMESGILGFGIWNSAQWIRNIANNWNPEFKFHWQAIRPLESKIQDCPGFIGIGRKIVLKIQCRIQGRGPGGPPPIYF